MESIQLSNYSIPRGELLTLASLSWFLDGAITTEQWAGLLRIYSETSQFCRLNYYLPQIMGPTFLEKHPFWWEYYEEDIEWCLSNNIQLLVYGDKGYPQPLSDLSTPPLLLSCLGNNCWENAPSLSIVGSRQPNHLSLIWMEEEIGELLRNTNSLIVSGGARGVDQKAHGLCIQNSRATVCFLPCGLKELYPRTLEKWRLPVVKCGGAFLSQFAPSERMRKFHFHSRNHLIAAFSQISLVVEARRRSGSLITAKAALDLGRVLCAVPCSPKVVSGMGTIDLLHDGANLIRDCSDLTLLMVGTYGQAANQTVNQLANQLISKDGHF